MREIKFRAWNGKKMSSPFSLEDCCNECGTYKGVSVSQSKGFPMGGCKIMQFTGLKDVNNVDIYEGDKRRERMENYFDFIADDGTIFEKREKIGNIYENPELIHTST